MKYRPDIDGLRALAIVPVVLFHASIPGFSGGFVGVDVFFVISGYLITGIISRELASTGSFDFWNFYARRARRLLPAAMLVITISAIAALLILVPMRVGVLMKSALAALFYGSNILYWHQVANYFNPISDTDIYLHTWSLAVEEQFYLAWPALMLIAFRKNLSLGIVMGVLGAASFAACVVVSYDREPTAFFMAPFRAWEFAAGALAGLVTIKRLAAAASIVGVAMIGFGVTCLSSGSVYPGYLVGFPVAGTALLLMSGTAHHPVSAALKSAPAVVLGRYSYSWYLWHWPVLILGQELTGNSISARLALAVFSLALAALTFSTIEHPIRSNRYLAVRPKLSLAAIGAVSALSAAALGAVWLEARSEMFSPRYRQFAVAMNDKTELPGCITDFGDSKLRVCAFGKGEKTVALFGDSHALMFFPALQDVRVLTFLKSACPAADVPAFNRTLNRVETECSSWRRAAIERIRKVHPDVVILTSAAPQGKGPEQWRAGYRSTLSALAPITTVLIDATPQFPFSVPECLARGADCRLPRSEAIDPRLIAAEKSAADGIPNARVVNLTDKLCGPAMCGGMNGGAIMYADTNHITTAYAKRFAGQLGI